MAKKDKPQSPDPIGEPILKPKMRISLLDNNLVKLDDRLVIMDAEFNLGPKTKHTGPIGLEVILRDKEDVNSFKVYLDKLVGDLPLPNRPTYKPPKQQISLLDEEPLKDLLKDAEKKCKSIDELITYLRNKGFVFVNHQFLSDSEFPTKVKENHLEYQFMIRKIKEAKDPKNDKYDPQLVVGIQFAPTKQPNVKVYLYNEFLRTIKMEWEEQSSTTKFKKINLTKFPPYMVKEERERYRLEERKYQLGPTLEKSKFWLRWNSAVEQFNK